MMPFTGILILLFFSGCGSGSGSDQNSSVSSIPSTTATALFENVQGHWGGQTYHFQNSNAERFLNHQSASIQSTDTRSYLTAQASQFTGPFILCRALLKDPLQGDVTVGDWFRISRRDGAWLIPTGRMYSNDAVVEIGPHQHFELVCFGKDRESSQTRTSRIWIPYLRTSESPQVNVVVAAEKKWTIHWDQRERSASVHSLGWQILRNGESPDLMRAQWSLVRGRESLELRGELSDRVALWWGPQSLYCARRILNCNSLQFAEENAWIASEVY